MWSPALDLEPRRLASTGLASTGLASTGLASTGLASTGLASTGLASTEVAFIDSSSRTPGFRDAALDSRRPSPAAHQVSA